MFFYSYFQPQFAKMVQLIDIFAKPMICLLRELVQWFEDQGHKKPLVLASKK